RIERACEAVLHPVSRGVFYTKNAGLGEERAPVAAGAHPVPVRDDAAVVVAVERRLADSQKLHRLAVFRDHHTLSHFFRYFCFVCFYLKRMATKNENSDYAGHR